MNCLIINFSGLGDGFIEIPFLKSIEIASPGVRYFHNEGLLFKDAKFIARLGLESLKGVTPSEWRKFKEADWGSIIAFIEAHDIKCIINFRNLGPAHDKDYFAFKAMCKNAVPELVFWDFYSENERQKVFPVSIRDQISHLLLAHHAIDESLDQLCLKRVISEASLTATAGHSVVGINIHSGSVFKLWPYEKWKLLCSKLVDMGYHVKIFSGVSKDENGIAQKLNKELEAYKSKSAHLVTHSHLSDLLHEIATTNYFISSDSGLLHAATGLGVKTIGLYIVTSPVTWGGYSEYFYPVTSRHLEKCENFDPQLGICRNHYKECPLIVVDGDGIEVADVLDVFKKIQ